MFSVHVISDLNLGYNEHTPLADSCIPKKTDLVIINGNIGSVKRSMLYTFDLANKYPEVQFLYNLGELEKYWKVVSKYKWELEDSMNTRMCASTDWPKNLHWKDPRKEDGLLITLRTGQTINIFSTFGIPRIISHNVQWEETCWYRNFCSHAESVENLNKLVNPPEETRFVKQGSVPVWFTAEFMNSNFLETEAKIKKWELSLENNHFGILVTHVSPWNDPRCVDCTVAPYRIHLNKGLWITSTTQVSGVNYLGAKLFSNPGRGSHCRSQIVCAD